MEHSCSGIQSTAILFVMVASWVLWVQWQPSIEIVLPHTASQIQSIVSIESVLLSHYRQLICAILI